MVSDKTVTRMESVHGEDEFGLKGSQLDLPLVQRQSFLITRRWPELCTISRSATASHNEGPPVRLRLVRPTLRITKHFMVERVS